MPNKNTFSLSDSQPLLTAEHPWWKGALIYQIYPRSFQDSNGDGIGDIRGIINRLDYLHDLGVDGLWISPFYPSPMDDFGYDVSEFCAVDPMFGTVADVEELVREAEKRNIAILMDLVFSHTSNQHSWFQESRRNKTNAKADYYVWADPQPDGTPPTNWLAHFGGPAWDWDSKRGQYYLHNFLKSMPDLNVHHPDVQNELLDVMRFWLDKGVRGFRLDVVDYYFHDPSFQNNPPLPKGKTPKRFEPYLMQEHLYNRNHPAVYPFLERMRGLCDEYGDVMMVAEISEAGGVEHSAAYTAGGKRMHTSYNFDFLSQYFSPQHFKDTIETFKRLSPDGWPSWSFSNHDAPRVASRWGGDAPSDDFKKMINALLLSLEGTLYIYQGQELGLEQDEIAFEDMKDPYGIFQYPENKGRDGCRTPFVWESTKDNAGFTDTKPWLPMGAENKARAADTQQNDEESVLSHVKDFIALRQNDNVLKWGACDFVHVDEALLVFDRSFESVTYRCVFNFSSQQQVVGEHLHNDGAILSALGYRNQSLAPHGYVVARIL